MSFWRLYYHLVWATKERQALITPEIEARLYKCIGDKAVELECRIHALGGIENHIHVVASIPPQLSIADFVKEVKGNSSHFVTSLGYSSASFGWQRGYGVFSLGGKQLNDAVEYALNQKEHHQKATTNPMLEQTDA